MHIQLEGMDRRGHVRAECRTRELSFFLPSPPLPPSCIPHPKSANKPPHHREPCTADQAPEMGEVGSGHQELPQLATASPVEQMIGPIAHTGGAGRRVIVTRWLVVNPGASRKVVAVRRYTRAVGRGAFMQVWPFIFRVAWVGRMLGSFSLGRMEGGGKGSRHRLSRIVSGVGLGYPLESAAMHSPIGRFLRVFGFF